MLYKSETETIWLKKYDEYCLFHRLITYRKKVYLVFLTFFFFHLYWCNILNYRNYFVVWYCPWWHNETFSNFPLQIFKMTLDKWVGKSSKAMAADLTLLNYNSSFLCINKLRNYKGSLSLFFGNTWNVELRDGRWEQG